MPGAVLQDKGRMTPPLPRSLRWLRDHQGSHSQKMPRVPVSREGLPAFSTSVPTEEHGLTLQVCPSLSHHPPWLPGEALAGLGAANPPRFQRAEPLSHGATEWWPGRGPLKGQGHCRDPPPPLEQCRATGERPPKAMGQDHHASVFGRWDPAPADLEGGAYVKEDYSPALMEFRMCLGTVTPFFSLISPFWKETVLCLPHHCIFWKPLSCWVSQFHGWRGSCLQMNLTLSLTHI